MECNKNSLKECHFLVCTACSPEESAVPDESESAATNMLDSMYHEHIWKVSEVGKNATAEKFPMVIVE